MSSVRQVCTVGTVCNSLQIGGGHNVPAVMTDVAVRTIKESRQLRLQPFNEYRKRFNLQPYTSFRHFTGKNYASGCKLRNLSCS